MKSLGKHGVLMVLLLMPAIMAGQTGVEAPLPEGTLIKLQLNDYLSTKLSHEGESFSATVIAPVYIKDRVVIPKGSTVAGSISRILRPGRFKGKAMMNLIFSSIRLPGAAESIPIVASLAGLGPDGSTGMQAEGTVVGEESKGKDAAKVAAPGLSGAAIGGIVGGGRGAAIGAGVGAAVGLASILAGRGKDLEIRRGSTMDIVLDRPLMITEAQIVIKR